MSKKNLYYAVVIVAITAALTVAITLKLSRSRSAPPVSRIPNASLVARATTPVAEPKGAQKEAIKVHGHWIIDVRNPDGTLVTHREFENALTGTGASMLTRLLTRGGVTGDWIIELGGAACDEGDTPNYCEIDEHPRIGSGSNHFHNLVLTTPPAQTGFVLSGSATAAHSADIGHVVSYLRTCTGSTTSPAGCFNVSDGPGAFQFTYFNLATPVHVVPGQFIQVTLTISFS